MFEPTADRVGITASTPAGSRVAALVQLAALLSRYAKASEKERGWLQRQLESATHALALRFIEEKD